MVKLAGSATFHTRPLPSYVMVVVLLKRSRSCTSLPVLSNTAFEESGKMRAHPFVPLRVLRMIFENSPPGDRKTPAALETYRALPLPSVMRTDLSDCWY